MKVYFDNAATTALCAEAKEAMVNVMENHYGNPSSIHAIGRQARTIIEEARKTVAQGINSSIGEIFFTSGGTESNNMALKCAVRDLGVKTIISSPIEHHCVLHTLEALEKNAKVKVRLLDIDSKGRIDYHQLENWLSESTDLTMVSLMHSNNEIGTLLDLQRVSALCDTHKAFFHTDTVQTMGYYPIDVSKIKISFLSGSAHKFHGPKGVGFIYINQENQIAPIIDGGAQERNMRAGTENIYGIAGLKAAFETAIQNMESHRAAILKVKAALKERLIQMIPGLEINSPPDDNCHYKVLNVQFPENDKSEMLLLHLDILGICASGGSACSSGSEKASHVISALGPDKPGKAIRFSFSHYNTLDDIDFLIENLATLFPVKELT